MGVAVNGELSITGVKACLEEDAVKDNPSGSETNTAGSKIRVQGRMIDYWAKGINTWDPESLSSNILKSVPVSSEEEVSTVISDIDTLKLVDDIDQ